MKLFGRKSLFCSFLALFLFSGSYIHANTASAHPSREELRHSLIPVYQNMLTSPQFLSLKEAMISNRASEDSLHNMLNYLPMSPLEAFQIRMELSRTEYAIPTEVIKLHTRWVGMHEQLARSQYGDTYVDALLGGEHPEGTMPAQDPPPNDSRASVGTNRNVAGNAATTPEEYQGEIQVAVNPGNPSQIIAAANSMDSGCAEMTQAVFSSTDGGENWDYSCAPGASAYQMTCEATLGSPIIFGSDPAVWWDDAGNGYVEYMLLCTDLLGALGLAQPGFGLVVSSTSDGGNSFGGRGVIVNNWGNSDADDKNFYAIDRSASSPYHGRHYTCWDRNNNERIAYSSDQGATWTEVDLPAAAAGTLDLGCEMAIDDDGTVNLVFDTLTCGQDSCTNEQMFFTRSTNGGVSWTTPVMVQDFNLVSFSDANKPGAQDSRGINPFGAVEVDHSGGACDGTIYAVFSDFTSGNTVENNDVWLSRSTDNGASWSTPLRVNDDGEGGKIQFHPSMMVDQSNGDLVVGWHDARNDAANHAVDYYLARSTDCGLSFETNIQVSQPTGEFNNSGISSTNVNTADNANANANQFGEYLGLDVLHGTAYMAWCDSRQFFPSSTSDSQKENLGFATVSFPASDPGIFADGFESNGTAAWSWSTLID